VSEDAFALAGRLARSLEDAGIPYAIGGAIAYGLWGDPRGTLDVDLNLFVGHDAVPGALDVLESAGVRFDRSAALNADLEGDVLVGWCDGVRVDVFTPSIPFSWEAGRTAVRASGPMGEASYLSAEATAVFKLLFFRNKDLVDIEKLVAVQGPLLDRAYVRRWLAEMMGDDDQRVAFWDRVCATTPP
jgi:hypothetical protein